MELKGSYTVEASLLMPIILGIIVILLYMSFFLHDRAVMSEGAIILANRYCNEKILSNSKIKQKLLEDSQEVINHKVIVTKNITTQITVKNSKITVSSSGTFQFPDMYIVTSIINKRKNIITVNKSMERKDPVDFIRTCRKVMNFINP